MERGGWTGYGRMRNLNSALLEEADDARTLPAMTPRFTRETFEDLKTE